MQAFGFCSVSVSASPIKVAKLIIMQSTFLDKLLKPDWTVPHHVEQVCNQLGCRPSEKYYSDDKLGLRALVDQGLTFEELVRVTQPTATNNVVDDTAPIIVLAFLSVLLITCTIAGSEPKIKWFTKRRRLMLVWAGISCFWCNRQLYRPFFVEEGSNTLYQQFPNVFEMNTSTLHEMCDGNRTFDFVLTPESPDESWPNLFSPIESVPAEGTHVRFMALHFPQWYADPINGMLDDWRYFQNPNFTHNIKNIPIVRPRGHIYYDNRCRAVRRTQGHLAKRYGLDAIVYYIYYACNAWLLDEVLRALLDDGEPNIDFAFMWPNEGFGSCQSTYDRPDLFADILAPFFSRQSYVRIDGHPLFYIYLGNRVPNEFWGQLNDALAAKYDLPSIHLIVCIQSYGKNLNPVAHANGYAEFPPNTHMDVWNYHGHVEWPRYPIEMRPHQLGMTINFDNTPRMANGDPANLPQHLTKSRSVPGEPTTPEEFRTRCMERVKNWLMNHEDDKVKYPEVLGNDTNPKIVLVFAWNEWSEQATLEPSDLYGYGMLEAMRDCVEFTRALEDRIALSQAQ